MVESDLVQSAPISDHHPPLLRCLFTRLIQRVVVLSKMSLTPHRIRLLEQCVEPEIKRELRLAQIVMCQRTIRGQPHNGEVEAPGPADQTGGQWALHFRRVFSPTSGCPVCGAERVRLLHLREVRIDRELSIFCAALVHTFSRFHARPSTQTKLSGFSPASPLPLEEGRVLLCWHVSAKTSKIRCWTHYGGSRIGWTCCWRLFREMFGTKYPKIS